MKNHAARSTQHAARSTQHGNGVRALIANAPAKTCQVQPSADHLVGLAFGGDCQVPPLAWVRVWYGPRGTQRPRTSRWVR
jgi:hypothetical protein